MDIPRSLPDRQYDGPLRVGYIGVLTYNKGVHLIAQAAKKLSDPRSITVTIAGDGDQAYRNALAAEFEGIPVSFVGWVAPAEFYDKVDLIVVPSIWREPFGRVCIEAFAQGVPVLSSNIGGLATIVEDKRNGFLFNPSDSDQLAIILASLIKDRDQLKALRANCFSDAKLYEATRVCAAIREQLQTLTADKRPIDTHQAERL
jgi:glycosyltransferase involved in cell wall biosynthesis